MAKSRTGSPDKKVQSDPQALEAEREQRGYPPLGPALAAMAAIALGAGLSFAWFLSQQQPSPAWFSLGAGLVLLYLGNHRLPGLRERFWWRRSRKEAARLAKGVRRAIKKQQKELGTGLVREFEEALSELEAARDSGSFPLLEKSAERLDALAIKHLHRKSSTREYIEQIGIAVALALCLRAFVYEPFKIPSASMVPTLLVGDHLFVNKFTYGLRIPFTTVKIGSRYPNRGEVVVFMRPVGRGGDDIIKRVVGLPGDVVEVRAGRIRLNGEALPVSNLHQVRINEWGDSEERSKEGYFSRFDAFDELLGGRVHEVIANPDPKLRHPESEGRWVVQEGHIFVMGDNRDNSADSRMGPELNGFGQIPIEYIVGRADLIWLSKGGPYGLRFDRLFSRIP